MSKKFSIIHDLGPLSESERKQYLIDASEFFGLDPSLNALDAIWMDGGDGARRLIPYARRGTTDILREIHGIHVLSLTQHDGPGYVSFTAIGKTRSGRQEIAVGAAATEGLRGDKLAAAIATGQTRALRRLTLQAVGGGILDESELNQTTVDINRANTSLASMATLPAPQPTVTPNAEAGKDVTKDEYVIPVDALGRRGLPMKVGGQSQTFVMEAPAPFSSGTITPQPIPGTEEPGTLVQIEPAEPKRRRRRTKAEMAQAAINVAVDAVAAQDPEASKLVEFANKIVKEAQTEIPALVPGPVGQAINQVVDQVVEQAAAELMPVIDYPTAEQEADYRKRLQSWVDVLKTAGMTGGINWRLKRYTLAMFPDAIVDNGRLRLTCEQWNTLLADFEKRQPQDLVMTINTVAEKA